jgi:Fic family protein
VILMQDYPVFGFLPFETLISRTQDQYYTALGQSDQEGNSTLFIEYMLEVIHNSLRELLSYNQRILKDTDRLEYFCSLGKQEFTRMDYLNVFKEISSATASRDLKKGADMKLFIKTGDKNMTVYKLISK